MRGMDRDNQGARPKKSGRGRDLAGKMPTGRIRMNEWGNGHRKETKNNETHLNLP